MNIFGTSYVDLTTCARLLPNATSNVTRAGKALHSDVSASKLHTFQNSWYMYLREYKPCMESSKAPATVMAAYFSARDKAADCKHAYSSTGTGNTGALSFLLYCNHFTSLCMFFKSHFKSFNIMGTLITVGTIIIRTD